MKPSDIRVCEMETCTHDYQYRAPIKFGGAVLDRVTIMDVRCTIETRAGKMARGFASMPLGNVWSFPSRALTYEQTLAAMKAVAEQVRSNYVSYAEYRHPVDITHALEAQHFDAAVTLSKNLAEPIPRLCTLVAASPFDAAIHDAFGKSLGLNCFATYGPDFMSHDLAYYLDESFRGEPLGRYVERRAKPTMPLYHLVGALDPLSASDVARPINDGLPETLADWIDFNGLTHLKIKLNGDDLDWDVDRVLGVDAVAVERQKKRGITRWFYSLDFNERCANVDYLLEFMRQLKARAPAGFERIQYIEQPTGRDLEADRGNTMHEAARWRPIVIDESLLGLDSLILAKQMGYTGVALKACKGQTQSLLMAAAAQKCGMFLCVQDLTCPGASLVHSAALAAHIPGVAAIEANSRQYCPAANADWATRFPGIFQVSDGSMRTDCLDGMGLGVVSS